MTVALFNQLYSEPPFNGEYELLYELLGKLYKGREYVLFVRQHGIRKFDITDYRQKIKINTIEKSIYHVIRLNLQSLELLKIEYSLKSFFEDLQFERDDDGSAYRATVIDKILNEKGDYFNRENERGTLFEALDDVRKEKVLAEYQKGVDRL